MKYQFIPLFLALSITISTAQETQTSTAVQSLDQYQQELGLDAIPNISGTMSMKDAAFAAFESGDCDAAVPALKDFADEANYLANLVKQGVQPFYQAQRMDSEKVPAAVVDQLARAETVANDLVFDRNIAWVRIADCLAKQGETVEAAAQLHQALRYISVREQDTWNRARSQLWSLVGYDPNQK